MIHNIERDSLHYAKTTLPFPVNESDNMFKHYKSVGYDFEQGEK